MGIISDFVVATRDDALLYYQLGLTAERHLPAGFDRAEYKNYVPPQLNMLWAVLRGEDWDVDRHGFEHICHWDDGSQILERFPDDFVSRLAGLNDISAELATRTWVKVEEVRGTAEDHAPALCDLRRLALNALQDGKGLFLYLSL